MSAPNLHVALALALGRPTSDTDAQLIDRVYALRQQQPTAPTPRLTLEMDTAARWPATEPLFDLPDETTAAVS